MQGFLEFAPFVPLQPHQRPAVRTRSLAYPPSSSTSSFAILRSMFDEKRIVSLFSGTLAYPPSSSTSSFAILRSMFGEKRIVSLFSGTRR